jgi:hypothetical protein
MDETSKLWWIRLPSGKVKGPFPAAKVIRGHEQGQVPEGSSIGTSAHGPWRGIETCARDTLGTQPSTTQHRSWHVASQGERHGPHSERELKARIHAGTVGIDDLAWTKGMPGWIRMGDVPQFAADFASQAESPPPLPDDDAPPPLAPFGSDNAPTQSEHAVFVFPADSGAVAASTAASIPTKRGGADDVWAVCALALPIVSIGGLWLWAQNFRVIDLLRTDPMQVLWSTVGLTLIGCGVFVAADAARLGIGGPEDLDAKGRQRANGPAHWGLLVALLFLIGYPSYMGVRSRRGATDYMFAAVAVLSGYIIGLLFLWASLEAGLKQAGFRP